jgi:hypothetical protein
VNVAQLDLKEPRQESARSQMLSLLGAAHQYRETRLFEMTQSVPWLIWVLLIAFGAVLVGFLLCFGIEYVWSQVLFTGMFAAAIAFVLVIVSCSISRSRVCCAFRLPILGPPGRTS